MIALTQYNHYKSELILPVFLFFKHYLTQPFEQILKAQWIRFSIGKKSVVIGQMKERLLSFKTNYNDDNFE